MLYLNPPFLQINGLSLLPDHADPAQWYFMPMGPHLVARQNAAGKLLPAFQLVRFKKAGTSGGGFLNFDVSLGVDQSLLDDTAGKLQGAAKLPKVPRLSPVLLEDGAVKLIILGRESGDAADNPRFVQKIVHAAKPSLFGDNQAAFSVELDEDGATLIDKTLDGELTPIGVVYSLDYVALRPAFAVHLTIDWDRVQSHLDENFSTGSLFISSDINKVVDKLVDDRVIDLQVDTLVVADDSNKSVIKDRDQAVGAVYDMITDAFFTASINPTQHEPDGWDKAIAFFDHMAPASQIGGMLPSYSYSSNQYDRTDKKRLNVTMEERTAVKRSIYPQGHLTGIADAIRQSGEPRGSFVIDVDLNDDWYKRRTVRVIPRIDFTTGQVVSVSADLRYDNLLQSAIISADSTSPTTLDWTSVLENGRMVMPVQATVTMNLTAIDDLIRPHEITAPAVTVEGEVLEVFGQDFFSLMTIPVMTDGVPWDRYSAVEVNLRYADPDHGILQQSTFDLTSAIPTWNYQVFAVDQHRTSLDYRLVYRGIGRPDVQRDWTTTDDGQVRIRDPYPSKRDLTVVPLVSWADVATLLVDLVYEDSANALRLEKSLVFGESAPAPQVFSVDLRDPQKRVISYNATFLFKDGHQVTIPHSDTVAPRIILSPTMKAHRVVTVQVDTARAAALSIDNVKVVLAAGPPDAPVSELRFMPGAPAAEFEFDYDGLPTFRYEVVYKNKNGMERTVDWAESQQATLALGLT
jgi:hypothetical protein